MGTGTGAATAGMGAGRSEGQLEADLALSRDRNGYLPWRRRALFTVEVREVLPRLEMPPWVEGTSHPGTPTLSRS